MLFTWSAGARYKYPGEVHTHAAKIAPNVVDKDELTLAQAQKPELQFE